MAIRRHITKHITSRDIDTAIKRVAIIGQPATMWDVVSGFGVRVSPPGQKYINGKVSYFVFKRRAGRGSPVVNYTFASYPQTNVESARAEAIKLMARIKQGDDIAGEKRATFNQWREVPTFEAVYEKWVETSKTGERHKVNCRSALKSVPDAVRSKPIIAVTRVDMRSAVKSKALTNPGAAKNMNEIMRTFWRWAVEEEEIVGTSPMSFKYGGKIKPRTRALDRREICALWAATEVIGPPFRQLYRLLLILGQRKLEIGALKWTEVDPNELTIILPPERTKTETIQIIPLPQLAVDELKSIKQEGVYVFSLDGGKTRVQGYSKVKRRIDTQMFLLLGAQFKKWQLRDIRRTVRTNLAALKCPREIAEQVLSHRQKGIVGTYNACLSP
jgi:integrase